jgi:phosphatidylserine decarboxylase
MYTTLLFNESPLLSSIIVLCLVASFICKLYIIFVLLLLILIFVCIFYRYKPHTKRYDDNVIISPANGTVTSVETKNNKINMSIYINFFNNHTQIYPVNGLLLKKIYDNTGKFELANNVKKSRFNEKKIHTIKMKNGGEVKVTQIAGFFPRRIVSAKKENEKVMAGEYLGIIKFGSRVDLEFDGDISKILIKENQQINIGDMIYTY